MPPLRAFRTMLAVSSALSPRNTKQRLKSVMRSCALAEWDVYTEHGTWECSLAAHPHLQQTRTNLQQKVDDSRQTTFVDGAQ